MSSTIFSFFMSILWCNIFTILLYILFQKKQFVVDFSIYPLLFLIILSILRLIVNIEFPFTSIIRSAALFPALIDFFTFTPFHNIADFLTIRMMDIFLIIWIAGSIYSLYKICIQDIYFKKLMSKEHPTRDKRIYSIMDKITDGKTDKICIIETSLIDIPMIAGLIKPTIYLPCIPLSDTEIYNILLHEWTHYVHKDIWIKLLVKIICVIYWWNPFIYLLKYNIDNTLEVKSDLYLTNKMSKKEKLNYLQTILKIARNHNMNKTSISPTSIGLISKQKNHPLKQRFDFVLECKSSTIKQKLCIILSIIMIFLFLGSYSFVIQPYTEPDEFKSGVIFEITSDNSFIIKNKDDIYCLYVDNEYICYIDDITIEPYVSLEIIEMEK